MLPSGENEPQVPLPSVVSRVLDPSASRTKRSSGEPVSAVPIHHWPPSQETTRSGSGRRRSRVPSPDHPIGSAPFAGASEIRLAGLAGSTAMIWDPSRYATHPCARANRPDCLGVGPGLTGLCGDEVLIDRTATTLPRMRAATATSVAPTVVAIRRRARKRTPGGISGCEGMSSAIPRNSSRTWFSISDSCHQPSELVHALGHQRLHRSPSAPHELSGLRLREVDIEAQDDRGPLAQG